MYSNRIHVCVFHHLSLQSDQGIYHEKVREMIRRGEYRLLVNLNDLRRKQGYTTRAEK